MTQPLPAAKICHCYLPGPEELFHLDCKLKLHLKYMQINAYRYPECNVSVPENHTLFSHKYPSWPKMYYSYSSADPRSPLLLLAQAIKMCCIQKHGPFTQWYDIFLCKKLLMLLLLTLTCRGTRCCRRWRKWGIGRGTPCTSKMSICKKEVRSYF